MFKQLSSSYGNVIGFKIGESITAEDVHDTSRIRIMAEAIAASGRIRLQIEIEGFRHMEPQALLEKLKFERDHARDIEKMAVVSGRTWIKAWLKGGGLFMHKDGQHFNLSEIEAAWNWVRQ